MKVRTLLHHVKRGLRLKNLRSIWNRAPRPSARKHNLARGNMGESIPGLTSIIIPTMHRSKTESLERLVNPLYTLKYLLRDIHTHVTLPFEVIAICNETKNTSFINYVKKSPCIDRACFLSENIGVPRAWNVGAQMALGEYLCFVNDDVEIGVGALEALVDHLKANPNVGIVSPAGSMWHRQSPGISVGKYSIEEADVIGGWLFVTPRAVFNAAHGFDIAYTPALAEEIDYSFAVRSLGYLCHVLPGLHAVHHHIAGASSTNIPIQALGFSLYRDELTQKNAAYLERKWAQFWTKM